MSNDKNQITKGLPSETKKEIPDYYTNSVRMVTSLFEFMFEFGKRTKQDLDPESFLIIRMSPQHAKVFSILLAKNVGEYEKNLGEIKLPEELVKSLEPK